MNTELVFTLWVRAGSADKAARAIGRLAAQAGLDPELLGVKPHGEDPGLQRCQVAVPCPGDTPAEAVVCALRVAAAFAERWAVRAPGSYDGGAFDFEGHASAEQVRGPGLELASFRLTGTA